MELANRVLGVVLLALLAGCVHEPNLGMPLLMEDAERIKTVEVVVIAKREPLQISRMHFDSSQTSALRNVGGALGAIAANAMESNANSQYARTEEEARRITKRLLSQVEGMDYRETLRAHLESALKKDGRFKITKVVSVEEKEVPFGSAKYAQSENADAVLFVSPYLEMTPVLRLKNDVYYRLVAKSGEVVVNDLMWFFVEPPGSNIEEKMAWWIAKDRYRNVVGHSAYAVAVLLNNQIFNKNEFVTRSTHLQELDEARKSSNGYSVVPTITHPPCTEIPSSDGYSADSYTIRKIMRWGMYDGALKCSTLDSQ